MGRKKISIDDLYNEVEKTINDFEKSVDEKTADLTVEYGKIAKNLLRDKSPKLTGDYAKGWAYKKTSSKGKVISVTVYNKTDYQLTHLLEFGHAKRGGGRVRAIPHIKPVEEQIQDEFPKAVARAIEIEAK